MHTTKSLIYNIIVILDKKHYFSPSKAQAAFIFGDSSVSIFFAKAHFIQGLKLCILCQMSIKLSLLTFPTDGHNQDSLM